eukprot:TRINITY_DN2421_c0_g1_i3.p1 TRINITY_DN2421_c0_g1~~TRINITY_DN2421_c0_g1_i3.p1  ORF type:complete len:221 (+),score=59.19 TRINITY_DN2421_c0_g1_i3:523-1185(+)
MPVESELSTQNLKDRYYGVNDPVARKLLRRAEGFARLVPPQDPDVATLYVGCLAPGATEEDVRDSFYQYGEIKTLRVVPMQQCAFVTYTTRAAAEKAADALFNNLSVRGRPARLSWGRRFDTSASTAPPPPGAVVVTGGGGIAMPPPPPPDLPPPPGVTMAFPPPMSFPTQAGGAAARTAATGQPTTAAATTSTTTTAAPPQFTTYYPSMDPSRLGSAPR